MHKGTSSVPKQKWNPRHSAKVLNSDFYLCPRSKPHLQNYLIDLKDFLTQTVQARRHTIKNKIVNIADTFFDMAADSLVPVLSGTHSAVAQIICRKISINPSNPTIVSFINFYLCQTVTCLVLQCNKAYHVNVWIQSSNHITAVLFYVTEIYNQVHFWSFSCSFSKLPCENKCP